MIDRLFALPSASDVAALHALLRDAVESNASVGFTLPLTNAEVAAYWNGVFAAVTSGTRVLLVARDEQAHIVGTVQLELAQQSHARHRCELQKLLVLRSHRGRRLGFSLMQAAEQAARSLHRTLLCLDTSAAGNALTLYGHCGYTRVGVIPRYATDPDVSLIDTVIYYKQLTS